MSEVSLARERSGAKTANAVRTEIRTLGGATENGYSQALTRSILSYEHNQRQEEDEAMAYFDDNGNMLGRVQGKKDRVAIREGDEPKENLILTHNHPWALSQRGYMRIGSSFSMEDALMAVKYKAKEIRAVTPTYTFSIKRSGDKWGVTLAAVRRAYEKAIREVSNSGQDYADRVGYSQTADNRYTITFWHKVNKIVAKEMGWNYTKKKG